MKPYLLYRKNDIQVQTPGNEADLVKDLNLAIIYKVMSRGDDYIKSVVSRVVPRSLSNPEIIRYRQEILKECIQHQHIINRLYTITTEASKDAAAFRDFVRPSFTKVVSSSVKLRNAAGLLEVLLVKLRELANLTQENTEFTSPGLYGFCLEVNTKLNTGFFGHAQKLVSQLKLACEGSGLEIGARVGAGFKGANYTLRKLSGKSSYKFGKKRYRINLKDYLSVSNAKEAEDAVFIHVLRIANHFIGTIQSFMEAVRFEIAFYLGCVHLYRYTYARDLPLCFGEIDTSDSKTLHYDGLYDLSLALSGNFMPISNSEMLDGKHLIFVTGANQGGKSTFLRSLGIAFILHQCGMQVPAESFAAFTATGIFTHFSRAEDSNMDHGKLEEELSRMSSIVDTIASHGLLLMNEAFATTTEREGAIIGGGILSALYELEVAVVYVTHLYELADIFVQKNLQGAGFLLAERLDGGDRSFRIMRGLPRETSYGEDLYNKFIKSPKARKPMEEKA